MSVESVTGVVVLKVRKLGLFSFSSVESFAFIWFRFASLRLCWLVGRRGRCCRGRCSLFVVFCSLFVVRCSLVVGRSSFVVHRLSLVVVHRWLLVVVVRRWSSLVIVGCSTLVNVGHRWASLVVSRCCPITLTRGRTTCSEVEKLVLVW